MTLIIPALAVAFGAICVWLTVRIVNQREPWAKWMLAVLAGLPVLFVASFGPACWWFASDSPPIRQRVHFGFYKKGWAYAPRIYWPIGQIYMNGPQPMRNAIGWYASRGGKRAMLPTDWDESRWISAN